MDFANGKGILDVFQRLSPVLSINTNIIFFVFRTIPGANTFCMYSTGAKTGLKCLYCLLRLSEGCSQLWTHALTVRAENPGSGEGLGFRTFTDLIRLVL